MGGPGVLPSLYASKLLIFQNQTSTLTVSVAVDGQGIPGANVTWTATGGTISALQPTTDSQGNVVATFTPTATGIANITAIVSSLATGTQTLSSIIQVIPTPKSNKNLLTMLLTFPYYLIIAAAAAGVVVLVLLLVRRRSKKHGEEAEGETEGFMMARLPRWPGGHTPVPWRAVV